MTSGSVAFQPTSRKKHRIRATEVSLWNSFKVPSAFGSTGWIQIAYKLFLICIQKSKLWWSQNIQKYRNWSSFANFGKIVYIYFLFA